MTSGRISIALLLGSHVRHLGADVKVLPATSDQEIRSCADVIRDAIAFELRRIRDDL
jgi:hypothetical protein